MTGRGLIALFVVIFKQAEELIGICPVGAG